MAGGASALLLQVANPPVAEAVARHSSFREDPLARLRATLDATLRITFGDARQAASAAASVATAHGPVRGRLGEAVGHVPAGTSYAAEDPHLAMWVHATLVWSALETYGRFVGPLTTAQRARYFEEAKRFARLFGVTEAVMPGSYEEFTAYWDGAVAGLNVGPTARRLADQILRPPFDFPLRTAVPAMRSVTASLLPESVRDRYALRLASADRALAATTAATLRATMPAWPPRARYWPHYLAAIARISSS
jgi:uncharacterized protein (DUF2236 family)